MYTSLNKEYPVYSHHWNSRKMGVMWGYHKVNGWGDPITPDGLNDWQGNIQYHERLLERIAKEILSEGVFKGLVFRPALPKAPQPNNLSKE